MVRLNAGVRIAMVAALSLGSLLASGQSDTPGRSVLRGAAVEYLFPEQITVAAGKPSAVALHFRVAPGLHINSHVPRDEFLIPTAFSIPEGAGVRLESASYPAGSEMTLALDPANKLSVYSGEFVIQARMTRFENPAFHAPPWTVTTTGCGPGPPGRCSSARWQR